LEYPKTLVIRVLKTLAVSETVQLVGGAEEKAKPGREGMTISKSSLSLSINGMNSRNDPGHPWLRIKGIAPERWDFSWIKWTVKFSTSVV
jgi:hypothetical protein